MKKTLIFVLFLISLNSFTAYVLNNKKQSIFTDKEMLNLISNKYDTEKELSVVSKVKGSNNESITKAENDVRLTLQGIIKSYSYTILSTYLKESGISGTGFDSKKMKDIADEIAKDALSSAYQKGKWITGKNETVILYSIEKETVRKMSIKMFRERLNSVIEKLTEYRNVFENVKIPEI